MKKIKLLIVSLILTMTIFGFSIIAGAAGSKEFRVELAEGYNPTFTVTNVTDSFYKDMDNEICITANTPAKLVFDTIFQTISIKIDGVTYSDESGHPISSVVKEVNKKIVPDGEILPAHYFPGYTLEFNKPGKYIITTNHSDYTMDIILTVQNSQTKPTTTQNTSLPKTNLKDIQNHWAREPILTLVNKGSINGYADGTFKPNNSITRAEFIKILIKALNKTGTDINTGFKDVSSNHWAAAEIALAKKLEITSGYTNGTFRPNSSITRAEIVSMISSAKKLPLGEKKVTFKDVNSHWAKDAIVHAASNDIVSGYQDMTFRPNNKATRAEACNMIVAMLNK